MNASCTDVMTTLEEETVNQYQPELPAIDWSTVDLYDIPSYEDAIAALNKAVFDAITASLTLPAIELISNETYSSSRVNLDMFETMLGVKNNETTNRTDT